MKIVPTSSAEPLGDQSIQLVIGALEAKGSYKANDQRTDTQCRMSIDTNDEEENPTKQEAKAPSKSEEASVTLHLLKITHWRATCSERVLGIL